jgi:hypothetical protein
MFAFRDSGKRKGALMRPLMCTHLTSPAVGFKRMCKRDCEEQARVASRVTAANLGVHVNADIRFQAGRTALSAWHGGRHSRIPCKTLIKN